MKLSICTQLVLCKFYEATEMIWMRSRSEGNQSQLPVLTGRRLTWERWRAVPGWGMSSVQAENWTVKEDNSYGRGRTQGEYSKRMYVGVREGGGLRGHLNDFKK